ncbi:MAG: antitoxin [Acidimicrobiia bacterium]|nr:antitoxin [Acidimicrobiia bacterium]
MGFMDKAKGLLKGNKGSVDDAVDKAADMADDKTGGKYTEQIDTGADKAKDALDDFVSEDE